MPSQLRTAFFHTGTIQVCEAKQGTLEHGVTPARNKRLDVFLPKLTEGDDASSDDSNDEDNAPVDFPPDSGP